MSDYAELVAEARVGASRLRDLGDGITRTEAATYIEHLAAALETLARERDEARALAEARDEQLTAEFFVSSANARRAEKAEHERDEARAALKDTRENRDGWQQRCADAEQKLYRTEQPTTPDIALPNKGGRDA